MPIKWLKAVHDETHPAARLVPKKAEATIATLATEEELLATLEDEAVEDDEP